MEFTFFDPGALIDGDLRLRLMQAHLDTSKRETIPTYRFVMVNVQSLNEMGFINLRIGWDANLILYRGHIGYYVAEEHRGQAYARNPINQSSDLI